MPRPGSTASLVRRRVPMLALFAALVVASPAAAQDAATPAGTPGVVADLLPTPTPAGTPGVVADLLPTPTSLPAGTPAAGTPRTIVATTGIVADLVAQVAGPRARVLSILPANADPHDFEPAPEDLVAIEEADAVFRHGLHLDEWSEALVENAAADVPVVVVTEGIETLASDEEDFEDGDPHVWFDPTRVETMVGTIAAALTDLDPEGAATYEARRDAYLADLRALDAAIADAIATIPADRRKLVTNHDAFGYYADRYGLDVVGTVIPALETTAEPSAQEIAELLELIEREDVSAIFAENTASPALAEELADQADVAIVDDLYSDSLGEPGSGADTYLGLMRSDTVLIVEALR